MAMDIEVSGLNGHLCSVFLLPGESGRELKAAIEKATDIPAAAQRLLCGVKELKDCELLDSLAPAGGGPVDVSLLRQVPGMNLTHLAFIGVGRVTDRVILATSLTCDVDAAARKQIESLFGGCLATAQANLMEGNMMRLWWVDLGLCMLKIDGCLLFAVTRTLQFPEVLIHDMLVKVSAAVQELPHGQAGELELQEVLEPELKRLAEKYDSIHDAAPEATWSTAAANSIWKWPYITSAASGLVLALAGTALFLLTQGEWQWEGESHMRSSFP